MVLLEASLPLRVVMDRLAFGVLWLFVFLIPWENVLSFPVFGSAIRLVGVTALALGAGGVLLRGKRRRLVPMHAVAFLFVAWAALSIIWTIDAVATRARVQTYAQVLLFLWLIWELAWSPGRQLHLLQAYVLGASVGVVSTVLALLSSQGDLARYVGLDYNPNWLGLAMALGLPMAWHLALCRPTSRLVWPNRLYVVVGTLAVVLTGSRGAILAAILGLSLVPWTTGRLRAGPRAAVFAAAAGTLYLVGSSLSPASLERLTATQDEIATLNFSGRGAIWQAGLQLFGERPFTGFGAGSFGLAIEPVLGYGRSPHQTLLSVLIGQGLVGLLLFLGMFASLVPSVLRMPAHPRRFWIVLLCTLLLGVQSSTWDYRKLLWLVLGLLAAAGAAYPRLGRTRSDASGVRVTEAPANPGKDPPPLMEYG